jgi:hypothetical protein
MPFQKGHKFSPKKKVPVQSEETAPVVKPVLKRTLLRERMAISYDGMDPNLCYRVVNDKDGRVEDAKRAGWAPVRDGTLGDDEGSLSAVSQPGKIVTRHVGGGITGVLMCKPRSLEEEDLKPLEERNKRIEESIFGEVDHPDRYGKVQVGDRVHERK